MPKVKFNSLGVFLSVKGERGQHSWENSPGTIFCQPKLLLAVYILSTKLLFILHILFTLLFVQVTFYSICFSTQATFSSIYFVVSEIKKVAYPLEKFCQWSSLIRILNGKFCSRKVCLVNLSMPPPKYIIIMKMKASFEHSIYKQQINYI